MATYQHLFGHSCDGSATLCLSSSSVFPLTLSYFNVFAPPDTEGVSQTAAETLVAFLESIIHLNVIIVLFSCA